MKKNKKIYDPCLYKHEEEIQGKGKAILEVIAMPNPYTIAIFEDKPGTRTLTVFLEESLLPKLEKQFQDKEQGFLQVLKICFDLHKQGKSIKLNENYSLIPKLKITIKGSEEQ